MLLTWALVVAALITIGLLPACLIGTNDSNLRIVRAAIWWGLLIATIAAYAINVFFPLRSAGAAFWVLGLTCVLGIPGWRIFRRRSNDGGESSQRVSRWLLGTLILTVVYFAATALGPITNYDSGLYHLGAIHYAGDFATIPGLANVYFALGYGNAEFPLAAFLGNGPWNGEGYRLLNGLVIVLLLLELYWRWRSRKRSAGTYALSVGALMALVPLVALADYWVTSPSQDSTVFVVTLVAVAYLTDFVTERSKSSLNASVMLMLSVMLVLLRPTMMAFALGVMAVVVFKLWRERSGFSELKIARPLLLVSITTLLAAIFAVLRDYILSGWVQFPLSLHAFHVQWLAVDPVTERTATLGYHRNPDDLWNAAAGWGWVGSWVSRLPGQWETFELLGAAMLAAAVLLFVKYKVKRNIRWKLLGLVLLPSVLSVLVWWVATPPSYRFIWGPVMSIPATLIGWGIWRMASGKEGGVIRSRVLLRSFAIATCVPVVIVIAFTAVTRTHWSSINSDRVWELGVEVPYAVAEIQTPQTSKTKLSSGLMVRIPTFNEQCWNDYELCTPTPPATLRLRGSTVQDGFLQ